MCDGDSWSGLTWLNVGQVAGPYKCRYEPSGSKNCGEFPEG
jgi:hypothetical protein